MQFWLAATISSARYKCSGTLTMVVIFDTGGALYGTSVQCVVIVHIVLGKLGTAMRFHNFVAIGAVAVLVIP